MVVETIIDKGKLQRVAKGVAGLVVTVGPVLLAWGATTGIAGGSQCALTEQQEGAIRSIVGTFELEQGCGLNVTIVIGPDGMVNVGR